MELKQIGSVKMAFAEAVFDRPSALAGHPLSKFALATYEVFKELLRTKYGASAITGDFSEPLIDSNNIFSANFEVKVPGRLTNIKLKCVLLENEKKFSANFLVIDHEEALLSVDVEYNEEKPLDIFIRDSSKGFQEKIVAKMRGGHNFGTDARNEAQRPAPVLRPVIPESPFYRPPNLFPPQPEPLFLQRPNYIPSAPEINVPDFNRHFRFDPVFPDDIGFGVPDPRARPPHPDVPEMGPGTGNLMGINHPFFRGRGNNNPNFPHFSGSGNGGSFF